MCKELLRNYVELLGEKSLFDPKMKQKLVSFCTDFTRTSLLYLFLSEIVSFSSVAKYSFLASATPI